MVFNEKEISRLYLDKFKQHEQQEEWAWYHCQNYFSVSRYEQLTITDYHMLSMHLSLYLAESNMYHGPSFISQNGYKIHREAVQVICHSRYHPLNRITCKKLSQEHHLRLLFELIEKLTTIYSKIRRETYERAGEKTPVSPVSQQLISKILLGTLACVPVFNKHTQIAYRHFSLSPQSFSPEGLGEALTFYQENQAKFKRLGQYTQIEEKPLPELKQLDIVFQSFKLI